MGVKALIIEPSYVVRRGFATLLDEIQGFEILAELSDLNLLESKPAALEAEVIFINPELFESGGHIYEIGEKYQARILALYYKPNHPFKAHFEDTVVYLSSKNVLFEQLHQYKVRIENDDSNTKNSEELSEREIDVLKCVALGCTNKEIAEKLFISTHTVISHRKNITRKLGIKTVSGLTVYAFINKHINLDDVSN
jgi:DNA-binding NarL/FixJ family response regulator